MSEHYISSNGFESKDSNRMRVYSALNGRVSLAELRNYLNENAPGVPDEEFHINYGTLTWVREATEKEIAKRDEQRARSEQRHAEWEVRTYKELKQKFGDA